MTISVEESTVTDSCFIVLKEINGGILRSSLLSHEIRIADDSPDYDIDLDRPSFDVDELTIINGY